MGIDPAGDGLSRASHPGSDNETMLELSMTSGLMRSSHPFKTGSSRALIGGYLAIANVSALPVFHQIRLKPLKDARLIRAEAHNSTTAQQHGSRAAGQQGSRAAGQIRTTTTLNTQVFDREHSFSETPRGTEHRAISKTKILPGQRRSFSKSPKLIFRLRTPL